MNNNGSIIKNLAYEQISMIICSYIFLKIEIDLLKTTFKNHKSTLRFWTFWTIKVNMIWLWGIGGALIFLLIVRLRNRPCIFCLIVQKRVNASILHEDELCMCIEDINPAAKQHYLVIPKAHIRNQSELKERDLDLGWFLFFENLL